MYKWYVTCVVLISCFVIAVVLFVISSLQNRNLIKKIGSDGIIFQESNAYKSYSSCINNAPKLQDPLNLDIIKNEENLIFGKYYILIEKNDKGNYRFKIMSMNEASFVSRYYDTEKELLMDIEKYIQN